MADATLRYHVELKAFPHVTRAFNLDRETLDTRFVKPWAAGEMIDYDDRRWSPEKTKLTVLEGVEVSASERGLGRGWGEVTRHCRDVTEAVVAEVHRGADARAEVEALKEAIAEVAAGEPLGFPDVIALAIAAEPLWRASEQLSLAEQAVWELLHQQLLEMLDADGAVVEAEGWQAIVLNWPTWAGLADEPVRLRAPRDVAPRDATR
jgi:hypothetical protein